MIESMVKEMMKMKGWRGQKYKKKKKRHNQRQKLMIEGMGETKKRGKKREKKEEERRNKTEGKTQPKDQKTRKFEIPCLLISMIEPLFNENNIKIIISSND